MSEINETFTERVDVTTQPDGAFIGTLEIDVRPGDRQEEQLRTLQTSATGFATASPSWSGCSPKDPEHSPARPT